ncbi:hypothetical protein [Candidatus Pantoea formicae]|uniref:hypothetical protein n=1 Tax=Candidatus Pantoea formicae TaxID=2608355 RepID=UPI003ED9ACCF
MGHYTIRTTEQEDAAIRQAQERIGEASVSKAFKAAIVAYGEHVDEIQRLRAALAQEQAQRQSISARIKQFQASMTALFDIPPDA